MRNTIEMRVRMRRTKPLFLLLRAMRFLGLFAFVDPTVVSAWWLNHIARVETRIGGRWQRIPYTATVEYPS